MKAQLACAVALGMATGCLDGMDDGTVDDEAIASTDQALFSQSGRRYWNYGRYDGMGQWWSANTIPVCFETGLAEDGSGFNGNSTLVTNFETYRGWMREAVEDSWGRVAHLRFVGWGPCPSRVSTQLAGWVAIHWATGSAVNMSGWSPYTWTRMSLQYPSYSQKTWFQALVRHEFGHVLGFDHEKDRPDYSGSAGTNCTRTSQPGTTWTEVYDVASIMNWSYCSEATGVLSPYDIYGVQRVYGRKPSGSIAGSNGRCVNVPGFNYTNGTTMQVYDCYGQTNDTWYRSNVAGATTSDVVIAQSTSSGVKALSTRAPLSWWGNWVEIQTLSTVDNFNRWGLIVQWKAIGDMCVAPRNPAAGDNRLIIEKCVAGLSKQLWHWDWGRKGRFRNLATGTCANVANASNATHTPINVYPCGSPSAYSNEVFTTTARGEIKWGGKCLNVANYYPVEGAELQLYDCAPAGTSTANLWYNELFHVSGRIWNGAGGVLSVAAEVPVNGSPLQMIPDDARPQQVWDVYF